jgi:hypothetical protein
MAAVLVNLDVLRSQARGHRSSCIHGSLLILSRFWAFQEALYTSSPIWKFAKATSDYGIDRLDAFSWGMGQLN